MELETVKVEITGKLAVITLNRPEKKNAITSEMYTKLTNSLESIAKDDTITMTVITGTGEYYCSGTDLLGTLTFQSGNFEEAIKSSSAKVRALIRALIDHPKILVAVVNGPAIGIAVTTLAICDLVYCVEDATFLTPFTRLGLVAEGCSSYTFPLIMGKAKACEMLLFNEKITSQEALNTGLVSKVYKRDELSTSLWPRLRNYAEKLPSKSLLISKQLMRRFETHKLHDAKRAECDALDERYGSEDVLNAVGQFMTRRSKL